MNENNQLNKVKVLKIDKDKKYLLIELDNKLNYEDGKFINVHLVKNNKTCNIRPYTISNIKGQNLTLFIGLQKNGLFSKYFNELKVNDFLYFSGPYNESILKKIKGYKKIDIFAFGAGYAVYRPLLFDYNNNLDKKIKINVFTFFNKKYNLYIKDLYECEFWNVLRIENKKMLDYCIKTSIKNNPDLILACGPDDALISFSKKIEKNKINKKIIYN